jgi:hypothetical protein
MLRQAPSYPQRAWADSNLNCLVIRILDGFMGWYGWYG